VLFDASNPLGPTFQAAIGDVLASTLANRRCDVSSADASLGPVVDTLIDLALAGKHIRAAFVWWGYASVAEEPTNPTPLLMLSSSLDLIHAGLLAHDDLIDASATRRGHPSTHQAVAAFSPSPNESLGVAGAVIGGAWLLQWGQQCADESGLLEHSAARAAFNQFRTTVLTGQMADAWAAAGLPLTGPDGKHRLDNAGASAEITALKTTSYTIVGPLRLGALAAQASPEQLAALAAYGNPLGRGFQARDDVLGVFGDEQLTGKPAGDDLRQGKATPLLATALQMASPAGLAVLDGVVGNADATPSDLEAAKAVIADCGALAMVETSIEQDLAQALETLDAADLRPAGHRALAELAQACLRRDR